MSWIEKAFLLSVDLFNQLVILANESIVREKLCGVARAVKIKSFPLSRLTMIQSQMLFSVSIDKFYLESQMVIKEYLFSRLSEIC